MSTPKMSMYMAWTISTSSLDYGHHLFSSSFSYYGHQLFSSSLSHYGHHLFSSSLSYYGHHLAFLCCIRRVVMSPLTASSWSSTVVALATHARRQHCQNSHPSNPFLILKCRYPLLSCALPPGCWIMGTRVKVLL